MAINSINNNQSNISNLYNSIFGIGSSNNGGSSYGLNDLAMIRYAGNSIIMEKHAKGLEPYASFITKDVEDDGIAWAFEQLHII